MGSRTFPIIVNLTEGYQETVTYQQRLSTFGKNTFLQYIKENWKRLLDGCFIH